VVSLLAPDPVVYLESSLEVHGSLEQVVGVREQNGVEIIVEENLREGRLLFGYALPTRRHEGLSLWRFPVPERPGPQARVHGSASREGRDGLRVGAGETQALSGQRVEARSPDPVVAVGPDVTFSQAVQNNQDDIHSRPPLGRWLRRKLAAGVPSRVALQTRASDS
jgi:hypothetical protein